MKPVRIILSGGGTGGHIYPAVATAEALRRRLGDRVRLLFVGAEGRMEMEKIPALGYDIKGLPVSGLRRSLSPGAVADNLMLPAKILRSVHSARDIIRSLGADAVVGFGGYASAPVLFAAQLMGVPTLIQEQNSYAGLTNRILGRRARTVCVAYEGMERFFSEEKIVMTGNPLRGSFSGTVDRGAALRYFGLRDDMPVVLVVGGSLGTRTLNEMMKRNIDCFGPEAGMQVIWQTGRYYSAEMDEFMRGRCGDGIWRSAFIERMDYAYAAADLVISRSGACTVSELCIACKPVIFVPSPNVAEDHQTKNARALVMHGAARMVADSEAVEKAVPLAREIISDKVLAGELGHNISGLAITDSADRVAAQIEKILR